MLAIKHQIANQEAVPDEYLNETILDIVDKVMDETEDQKIEVS